MMDASNLLVLLFLCLLPLSAATSPDCATFLRHLSAASAASSAAFRHRSSTTCNCSFPPLGCSADVVTELSLAAWNLSGDLSQFVDGLRRSGALAGLRRLDLSQNNLNGTIPDLLWRMPNLTHLNLSSNSLHGALSLKSAPCDATRVGDCRNGSGGSGVTYPLRVVDVSYNSEIRGSIPDGFCARFPNLTTLRISHNRFTAAHLTECQRLEALDASFNRLHGHMLESLPDMGGGGIIDFSHNQINDSGASVIAFVNRTSRLRSLDLSFNGLNGRLTLPDDDAAARPPTAFGVVELNVSHNQLQIVNLTRSFVNRFGISAFMPNKDCNGWCRGGGAASSSPLLARAPAAAPPPPHIEKPIHSRHHYHQLPHFVIIAAISTAAAVAIGIFVITMALLWRRRRLQLREHSTESKSYDPSVIFHESGSLPSLQSQLLRATFYAKDPATVPVVVFRKPLLRLTFADILRATAYFGGAESQVADDADGNVIYSCVLPGVLEDGAEGKVAIKLLGGGKEAGIRRMPAKEAEELFAAMAEVKHENLVPLLGYCIVGEEKLLIYKQMEGAMSLEELLGNEEEEEEPIEALDDWSTMEEWKVDDDENDEEKAAGGRRRGGGGGRKERRKNSKKKKKRMGRVGWEGRVKIGLGVARAIAYLHARQLVHGSLSGGCVVVEVGRAAAEDGESAAERVEVAAAAVVYRVTAGRGGGEGRYVAPECWGGRGAAGIWHAGRTAGRPGDGSGHVCSAKCDMYGLGVLLMEMVAGIRAVGDDVEDRFSPAAASSLVSWVRHLMKDGRIGRHLGRPTSSSQNSQESDDGSAHSPSSLLASAAAIIDPSLRSSAHWPALRLLHMAFLCTADSPSKRPSSHQVVGLLKELHDNS